MFFDGELRSSVRISYRSESFGLSCYVTPNNNYNIDAHVRLDFCCFLVSREELGGSLRIKGAKTLYMYLSLVSCSFKAYYKLHRLAFT